MLFYFAIDDFAHASGFDAMIGPGLVIGLAAGLISLLRSWLALAVVGLPALALLFLGYFAMQSPSDGAGMAGTMFWLIGLTIGFACCVAVLGGWCFDRFLLKEKRPEPQS